MTVAKYVFLHRFLWSGIQIRKDQGQPTGSLADLLRGVFTGSMDDVGKVTRCHCGDCGQWLFGAAGPGGNHAPESWRSMARLWNGAAFCAVAGRSAGVCMNSSISPATLQTAVFKCSLSGPSVDQTRNHQNTARTFLSSIRQIVRQPHY